MLGSLTLLTDWLTKRQVREVDMVNLNISADERNLERYGGTVKRGDVNDNVLQIQQALLSKGFESVGKPDGAFGLRTETAIQNFQEQSGLPRTGVMDKVTYSNLMSVTPQKVSSKPVVNGLDFSSLGKRVEQDTPEEPQVEQASSPSGSALQIVKGTRAQYKPTAQMNNISLDFNSFKGAKGTEVIIPDNASAETRAAAENFNQLVVDFAAKHGYDGYKNRGVKTKSENKRGISNTIHVEPFFQQDAAMEKIINENMEEFAQIYSNAFGSLPARMVAPHGTTNSKGVVDKGANSKTFGNELAFGNRIIDILQGGKGDSSSPAPVKGEADFSSLASGATFVDPSDGKTYKKP
jgi:peptidoglycan hydrolase-like protein with peptidoglycan-binding domain